MQYTHVLQLEGMRRPGLIVEDTGGVENSAVGASVSFDKILAAVLDNNDEVRNTVMQWLIYIAEDRLGYRLGFWSYSCN